MHCMPRLRAAGVRTVVDAASLAVLGLVEVVGHLPRIWREYRKLLAASRAERPELAILTDSPDYAVFADVLVIADEEHGGDLDAPRFGQGDELFPSRRAAVRQPSCVLQPDGRQEGIVAEKADRMIAVAEVRIMSPRAGMVHERARDRQCSHCPGLWRHPGRIISVHPRSITPGEPVRLGTARRD